jgi:hypothetical protein
VIDLNIYLSYGAIWTDRSILLKSCNTSFVHEHRVEVWFIIYLFQVLCAILLENVDQRNVGIQREKYLQCTCDVTLRGVRANFVVVAKQYNHIFRVCVCSLRYPACNAHAPYCCLWPVRLYNIFSHYFIKSTIKKNVIEHKMCVLIFSTDFVRNISHSNKKWARCNKKCILIFM